MESACTGIFIRVNINGEWQSVPLEDLPEESRNKWVRNLDREGLIRCIEVLCETLNECNK